MKSRFVLGILLISLGIAGFIYKGFSYESKETVLKIGSFEATADITKNVEIPKLLSVIAIVLGAALMLVNHKK